MVNTTFAFTETLQDTGGSTSGSRIWLGHLIS